MSNQGDTLNSSRNKLRKNNLQQHQRQRRVSLLTRRNNIHMQESKETQLELDLFPSDSPIPDGLLNSTDPSHQQELSQEQMLESHEGALTLTESDSVALSREQKLQSELFSPEDLEEHPLQQNNDQTLLKD